jgi:hypothetical protein
MVDILHQDKNCLLFFTFLVFYNTLSKTARQEMSIYISLQKEKGKQDVFKTAAMMSS